MKFKEICSRTIARRIEPVAQKQLPSQLVEDICLTYGWPLFFFFLKMAKEILSLTVQNDFFLKETPRFQLDDDDFSIPDVP